MRILIVGSGSIGSRHRRNLLKLKMAEIAWVSPNRRKDKAELEMGEKRFYSLSESLSFQPEAVFVCNPTSLHFETAAFYLRNKIPVYLEKPISGHLIDAESLENIVAVTGTFCMVGYQYRFHPTLKIVKEMVERGELGKIISVDSVVGEYLPDFHPEEDYRVSYAARSDLGGGVLLTLSHEIDYLCWLFGPMKSVFCEGGRRSDLEIDVEDFASLQMKTSDGIKIQLNMDYLQRPPVRTLVIRGTLASLSWNYYEKLIVTETGGKVLLEMALPLDWERNHLFLDSIKCFFQSIDMRKEPFISIQDGKNVLKIVDGAKRSMEKRSCIVL